jgi:hypothetical protein
MMIAYEREFLKAQKQVEQLIENVRQAGDNRRRIDEVERMIFAELLQIGLHLLSAFVVRAGDGDLGKTIKLPAVSGNSSSPPDEESVTEVRTLRRLPNRHTRRYVSIFGELTMTRWVYGTREGQAIEAFPLDAQLGLPAGEFSHVLEDWQQRRPGTWRSCWESLLRCGRRK